MTDNQLDQLTVLIDILIKHIEEDENLTDFGRTQLQEAIDRIQEYLAKF